MTAMTPSIYLGVEIDIKKARLDKLMEFCSPEALYFIKCGWRRNGKSVLMSNSCSLVIEIECLIAEIEAMKKNYRRRIMIDGKEKVLEFEAMAKPLIKWLNDNHHPHTTIIITPNSAEVLEGVCAFQTDEYIKD